IPAGAKIVTHDGASHARFKHRGKTVLVPLTEKGDRVRLESAKWYGEYLDHNDVLRGVPHVIDGPDGPLYADFHSLPHTYLALLDRAGATLKEAMQLARHSDPKLTMAVYGRAQLHDLAATVDRLPLPTSGARTSAAALAATGTDGESATLEVSSLPPAYRT